MARSEGFSKPTRIVFQWVLTIALVYLLSTYLEQYFSLTGGLAAYVVVGSLITLMNLIVRPVLHVVLAPFHFIFGVLATIALNWLFLSITSSIAANLDPAIVIFEIRGGVAGWFLVATVLGIANWIMKRVV